MGGCRSIAQGSRPFAAQADRPAPAAECGERRKGRFLRNRGLWSVDNLQAPTQSYMPNMTFRGVEISNFDVRSDEGGQFVRIHFRSDYSDTVAQKMNWPDAMPDAVKQAKLSGKLALANFILTPNDKELSKHEINLKAVEATDFQLSRAGGDEEEGVPAKTSLRFMVRSNEMGAEALLGTYWRVVGKGLAKLKIDYAKQETLNFEAKGEEERDASDEVEKGEVEENPGPVLASARTVTGSSRPGLADRRKRRGGGEAVVTDDEGQAVLTGQAAADHETARQAARKNRDVQ